MVEFSELALRDSAQGLDLESSDGTAYLHFKATSQRKSFCLSFGREN